MKFLYLALSVMGLVGPYILFAKFLIGNGPDVELVLRRLFASSISTFFVVDVVITGVAILAYVILQRRQLKRWPIYVAAVVLVGPSFALPLLFYFQEARK